MLHQRIDEPAELLLAAVAAVKVTPPPLGQVATRLGVLAGAAAELRGLYLQAIADAEQDGTAAEHDCRGTADLLSQVIGLPVSQARSDAGVAHRLARFPGLLQAVATGQVPETAARLIARAWTALPAPLRDQQTAQALLTFASLVDLAELSAKVEEVIAGLQPVATDRNHADAHDARALSLVDVGSQTSLRGVLDRLDGEELRQLLSARMDADRGGAEDTRSSSQRLMDALLSLVRGAHDGGLLPNGDRSTPGLVVITPIEALLDQPTTQPSLLDTLGQARADHEGHQDDEDDDLDADGDADLDEDQPHGHTRDHAAPDAPDDDAEAEAADGRPSAAADPTPCLPATAHTRGGTRIGPRTLQRLCCDATLTRLLLDPAGHPLDSNPTRRQISRRERRALEHRDGYRCQRRGCGRPAFSCIPHHIKPWHLGGPTTMSNMILLCRACHHQLHDRDTDLHLIDGRIIGPQGWVHGPAIPAPLLL